MKNEYPNSDYLMQTALSAGHIMREHLTPTGTKRTRKNDGTPVTEADTRINQLVVANFKADYPHIRVVGEEGNNQVAPDAEYLVLCDPIDGTIPYCRGIPISAFAIAVLKQGQPLVAVIYDPFMERVWHATRGQGAFMHDGKRNCPIKVSTHPTLEHSTVCMVWWKGSEYNLQGASKSLMRAGVTCMNPLSIAYFGGIMAMGQLEATVFPGRTGWETAAMQLIVEEAGGKVTNILGKPMKYGPNGEIKGHIMSNGLIHDELVDLIKKCH